MSKDQQENNDIKKRLSTKERVNLGCLYGIILSALVGVLVYAVADFSLTLLIYVFAVIVILTILPAYLINLYKDEISEKLLSTAKHSFEDITQTVTEIATVVYKSEYDKLRPLSQKLINQIKGYYYWYGYSRFLFSVLRIIVLLFGGIIGTILLFRQNQLFEEQTSIIEIQTSIMENQTNLLNQQNQLQDIERKSSLVFLFSNIMDAVDRELSLNKKERKLSPQLQARIIALSRRLNPYRQVLGDSLSMIFTSPEKSQLFESLFFAEINDSTMNNILSKGDFNDINASNVWIHYDVGKWLEFKNCRFNNFGGDLVTMDFYDCYINDKNLSIYAYSSNFNDVSIESSNGGIIEIHECEMLDFDFNIVTPYSVLNNYEFYDSFLKNGRFYLRGKEPSRVLIGESTLCNVDIDVKGQNIVIYNSIISYDDQIKETELKFNNIFNSVVSVGFFDKVSNVDSSLMIIPFSNGMKDEEKDFLSNKLDYDLVFTTNYLEEGEKILNPYLVISAFLKYKDDFRDFSRLLRFVEENYPKKISNFFHRVCKYLNFNKPNLDEIFNFRKRNEYSWDNMDNYLSSNDFISQIDSLTNANSIFASSIKSWGHQEAFNAAISELLIDNPNVSRIIESGRKIKPNNIERLNMRKLWDR